MHGAWITSHEVIRLFATAFIAVKNLKSPVPIRPRFCVGLPIEIILKEEKSTEEVRLS